MANNHNIEAVMHMLGYLDESQWKDALENYDIEGIKKLRDHNNKYWGLDY